MLNGIGLYIYENVTNKLYQISNDLNFISKAVITKYPDYKGLFIIGSDIDMIAQKYDNFSFKIGNLNTGILLATFLTLKDSVFSNNNYDLIENFNEEEIINETGMRLKNITINLIIGVKK